MFIRDRKDLDDECENCQCRKDRHYPRIDGLVCPVYKHAKEPKYFKKKTDNIQR